MSRAGTIQEERWRVQVLFGERVTHESPFKALGPAKDYYDTLHLPGHSKYLQHRPAGEERFKLLEQEDMREAPATPRTP